MLQVKQKDDRIFISQEKYVANILKKFNFTIMKTPSTLMDRNKTLIKDAYAKDVDVHLYRLMIRSLMYLTNFRPDIMFAVCAWARFQVTPKTSHIHAVKKIYKYLKGQPKLGLWKSTIGGCQFLSKRLILWQCKKQTIVVNSTTEAEYVAAASCYRQTSATVKTVNEDVRLQALVDGKKVILNETSIRRDFKLDDAEGTACLSNAAICEELARMGRKQRKETKVSQDKTPTKEHIPTPSHDPLTRGDDRLKLNELMETCTKLSNRVLSLEQINTNQAAEIKKLKKRVKKLEGKKKKRTHGLKRLYKVGLSARIISSDEEGLDDQEGASKQGRIAEIDADEDLSLINKTTQDQGRMNKEDLFKVNDLYGYEVVVDVLAREKEEQSEKVAEKEVSTADLVTSAGEVVTTIDVEAMMDADYKLAVKLQEEEEENYLLKRNENVQAEVADDNTAELKKCMEIVPEDDDEVTIEATPLLSKSPTIVDYKIYKEGKKSYFKIIRADENSQNYLTFEKMFKNFNREDLEVLRSIVEDNIWKYQQGAVKVHNWKPFYSCEVYCVTTQRMVYYLLVGKMYLFTKNILHQLWNDVRLHVDYEVEMAYDLIRLIRRHGVTVLIISDRDSRFASAFEDCLKGISKVGDSQLTGVELIREMTEKIMQIKNYLLAARSRQKSYTDVRHKPLEFDVGDMVMIKYRLGKA
nr:hypothetical protein [Tanacetum cinerariifolium]